MASLLTSLVGKALVQRVSSVFNSVLSVSDLYSDLLVAWQFYEDGDESWALVIAATIAISLALTTFYAFTEDGCVPGMFALVGLLPVYTTYDEWGWDDDPNKKARVVLAKRFDVAIKTAVATPLQLYVLLTVTQRQGGDVQEAVMAYQGNSLVIVSLATGFLSLAKGLRNLGLVEKSVETEVEAMCCADLVNLFYLVLIVSDLAFNTLTAIVAVLLFDQAWYAIAAPVAVGAVVAFFANAWVSWEQDEGHSRWLEMIMSLPGSVTSSYLLFSMTDDFKGDEYKWRRLALALARMLLNAAVVYVGYGSWDWNIYNISLAAAAAGAVEFGMVPLFAVFMCCDCMADVGGGDGGDGNNDGDEVEMA